MTAVLALERLFTAVRDSFVADGIAADNLFGWQVPAQHPYRPRIAWVPGDPGSAIGGTLPPKYPGRIPRNLGMIRELFTVYITATDVTSPDNELAQYHLVRMLHDAWFRAVYHAAHGTFAVRDSAWVTDLLERRSGATLRVVCEIEAPIPDVLPCEPLVTGPDACSGNTVDAWQNALNENTVLTGDVDTVLADSVQPEAATPPNPPPEFTGNTLEDAMGQHVESPYNKDMTALVTAADGDLACATGITALPELDTLISVSVNTVRYTAVGNGTKTGAVGYFSGDGGTTARAWNQIEVGDLFYWQGSVAGFELAATDTLSFWYEQRGAA